MGMSLTSKVTPYKKGFGPLMNDIYRIPFPNAYRLSKNNQAKANIIALNALKKMFKDTCDPETIAAIIYEPIQGEGGFIHADEAFYRELRQLTESYGILTIIDEIQTGFGRTGKMFASEYFKIDFDIIILAKSMASGMPISAITGKDKIMDASQIGGLGGTYGGNPLACAAALATIEVLEENLLARANAIGEKIHATFKRFEKDSPYVGNVRGVGAMMAFELVEDKESKKPATDLTTKLASYCRENKLSMITAGTYSNVVRILVPFTVSDDILERGLDIIEKGLKKL